MSIFDQARPLVQFSLTELLPFTIIYLSIQSDEDYRKTVYALLLSFTVVGIYGIMTYFIKANPYVLFVAIQSGYEGDLYLGEFGAERGALDGNATGIMTGPLPWGQYVLLILLFCIYLSPKQVLNHKLLLIVVLISFANCILTTKRSVMLPAILAVLYYVFFTQKHILRYAVKVIVAIGIIAVMALQNPTVQHIYESNIKTSLFFWDDKLAEKNDVRGSNLEMRLEQTSALFDLVSHNFIQGNGFGFVSEYTETNQHSDMRAFESIFFQVVAESGFIGLMTWAFFFLKLYQKSGFRIKEGIHLFVFHGLYWMSLILTGIQSSLWVYMILCSMMMRNKEIELSRLRNYNGI